MMMDCPRCGFSQPKDRYCANCGLDVDMRLAAPKPLWLRLLQNPNLHLSLIGALMCAVVVYILFSRNSFVSRGVHKMLGTPIASRDAGEGEPEKPAEPTPTAAPEPEPAGEVTTPTAAAAAVEEPDETEAPAPVAPAEAKRLELAFFEVSRESLRALIGTAESAGEGTAGRAFLIRGEAEKKLETLKGPGARKLGEPRGVALNGGQQITVVTPLSATETFQFGLSVQISKVENKEATVRWDSQLVLGAPDAAAESATARLSSEANLTGSSILGPQSALVLVLDPVNRRPRPETVTRAGDGPWTIFASEDFRAQLSDWVAVVYPK